MRTLSPRILIGALAVFAAGAPSLSTANADDSEEFLRLRDEFSNPAVASPVTPELLTEGDPNGVWFCRRFVADDAAGSRSWRTPMPWYRLRFTDSGASSTLVNTGLNPIPMYVGLPRAGAFAGTADFSEVEYLRYVEKPNHDRALVGEVTVGRGHALYSSLRYDSGALPERRALAYVECPIESKRTRSIILDARDLIIASGLKGFLKSKTMGSCSYRKWVQSHSEKLPKLRLRSGTTVRTSLEYEVVHLELSESRTGSFYRIDGAEGSQHYESQILQNEDGYIDLFRTRLAPWVKPDGLTGDEALIANRWYDWILDGRCGE